MFNIENGHQGKINPVLQTPRHAASSKSTSNPQGSIICKGCPWRVSTYTYQPGIIGLHEEIEQFYFYVLPTPSEHIMRNEVIKRVEAVVYHLWPQARVEVFGSIRTGILLPTSDIDLVVIGLWLDSPFRTLEGALVDSGVADPLTIRVLDKAAVPIIKFMDRTTRFKVDVSFNMQSGVHAAELVKKYMHDFPMLAKLALVLKQFLTQRNLNEVFTGGLSSYSLTLMCISFLQMHPRALNLDTANLGVLLLEFFELYGRKFNYDKVGISIKGRGRYMSKRKLLSEMTNSCNEGPLLCIEDPLSPGNDIARNSYGARQVKLAFEYAYLVLSQTVMPNGMRVCDCNQQSILGRIINMPDEIIQYRDWLRGEFEKRQLVPNTGGIPVCSGLITVPVQGYPQIMLAYRTQTNPPISFSFHMPGLSNENYVCQHQEYSVPIQNN